MENFATDVPVEILLPAQGRSRLLLMEEPRPVVKAEEVEVNGKIVFD